MSTPYVFDDEVPALQTVAAGDFLLLNDVSAGRMKRITVSNAGSVIYPLARGAATTTVIGFYGATGVDQGTMTATALTALTAATMSPGNAAAVWAWASSTEAKAFVARAKQAQTDLLTLMRRVDSVGLVNIVAV
jgi:hypothetical protein